MKELELLRVVFAIGLQLAQHARVNNARQEIIQDDVLIMKAHEPLQCLERRDSRVVLELAIVKAQEQPLKLRDDRIFIVTRIADEGAPRVEAPRR